MEMESNGDDDGRVVMDLMESLIVYVVQTLQTSDKYKALTALARKMHSAYGEQDVNLGLDEQGKILRIKFADAKKIVREQVGSVNVHDNESFS